MDWKAYLFAGFVGLLAAAVVFMIDRLKRSRHSSEDMIKEKERRLFTLYQNLEDMIDSVEEYVEEAKESIEKDKNRMSEMLQRAERLAANLAEPRPRRAAKDDEKTSGTSRAAEAADAMPAAPAARKSPPARKETAKGQTKSMSAGAGKISEVRRLQKQGLDEEKIAQELSLSRGEVSLILGLHKK